MFCLDDDASSLRRRILLAPPGPLELPEYADPDFLEELEETEEEEGIAKLSSVIPCNFQR